MNDLESRFVRRGVRPRRDDPQPWSGDLKELSHPTQDRASLRTTVAVALALIVLAGAVGVAFASGAASTRMPATVLVDTTPTPSSTSTSTSVVGSVRARVNGSCVATGAAEAARQHYVNDPACAATP